MKIKKLLQWVKSKILPSSVMRKSRMLIERLNKQRLNMVNLGLVFRNSKWSNYSKKNINQTKPTFMFKLIRLVVVLILLLLFTTLVMGVDFTKTVISFGYWQFRDATDYLWLCAAAGYSSASSILKPILLDLFARLFFPPEIYEVYKKEKYKEAHKRIRYTRGGITKSTKRKKKMVNAGEVGRMLGINLNLLDSFKNWNKSIDLFQSSFQVVKQQLAVTQLFKQVDDRTSLKSLKSLVRKDLKIDGSLHMTSANGPLASLHMWTNAAGFGLNSMKSYKKSGNAPSQTSFLQDPKLGGGLFNVTGLNSNSNVRKLATLIEFIQLPSTLKDLSNINRSKRWLYQYNLLHSRSLTGANSITHVKKLTSSGSYTFDMLAKNLWANNTLSKSSNLQKQFIPLLKKTYGNYFLKMIKNDINIHKNYFINSLNTGLEFTRLYESGYFWFLKRLHFLGNNDALSVKVLKSSEVKSDSINSDAYSELVTTNMRLAKVLIPFKENSDLKRLDYSKHTDLFYHNDSDILFSQSFLLDLYSIASDKVAPKSILIYYSLNSYSIFIGEDLSDFNVRFFSSSKNKSDLAQLFLSHPFMSPAYIDLINKKYTKDLYSFVMLNQISQANKRG